MNKSNKTDLFPHFTIYSNLFDIYKIFIRFKTPHNQLQEEISKPEQLR
jgi:hypothetical protein